MWKRRAKRKLTKRKMDNRRAKTQSKKSGSTSVIPTWLQWPLNPSSTHRRTFFFTREFDIKLVVMFLIGKWTDTRLSIYKTQFTWHGSGKWIWQLVSGNIHTELKNESETERKIYDSKAVRCRSLKYIFLSFLSVTYFTVPCTMFQQARNWCSSLLLLLLWKMSSCSSLYLVCAYVCTVSRFSFFHLQCNTSGISCVIRSQREKSVFLPSFFRIRFLVLSICMFWVKSASMSKDRTGKVDVHTCNRKTDPWLMSSVSSLKGLLWNRSRNRVFFEHEIRNRILGNESCFSIPEKVRCESVRLSSLHHLPWYTIYTRVHAIIYNFDLWLHTVWLVERWTRMFDLSDGR